VLTLIEFQRWSRRDNHADQCIVGLQATAQEVRPRSILVLDQSDMRGPFYYQVFSGLRSVVNADSRSHMTLYTESLDLSRFRGRNYEASLLRHFKEKYRDIPIGVVVAIGSATLELVLSWRSELWPAVPVVFAMVDEIDFARLRLPDGVTGTIVKLPLADSIKAAHAMVPGLQTVAFVGDAWDGLVVYRNWKGEIPARTIVQAHKGRIWAENQTSGGAVFRLSLPLASS